MDLQHVLHSELIKPSFLVKRILFRTHVILNRVEEEFNG